jgi:hypothetical protein
MEMGFKRSEDRSRKSEESANLRPGNAKYLNKTNFQQCPAFTDK